MKKREFVKKGILCFGALAFPTHMRALEYYPMPSEKKVAVIFGTWCGTSRDAAIWISEGMDGIAHVFDVREDPDPSKFDHLVIGGSIRNNMIPDLLRAYLEKNRGVIGNKIRGLFAVCGNMRNPVGDEQYKAFIDNQLSVLSGAGKVPSRVFLGRITWGLMDPETRKMMKNFPGIEEYDNLKRAECMSFGREILTFIG